MSSAAGLSLLAGSPAWAACGGEDAVADHAFGHAYGDPSEPCRESDEAPRAHKPFDPEIHDGPPTGERRSLHMMGLTGLSGGATLAMVGGTAWVGSLFLEPKPGEPPGAAWKITHYGGLGLAVLGGAMAVTGAVLLGIDAAIAPAPTPSGRGAQLSLGFRF